jgi:CHAT domain-containing protein
LERLLSRKTQVYLEENATEARLKTVALDEYRYVHFATHGFASDTNQEASGILLFPHEGSTERSSEEADSVHEDGVLRLDEVYNLKLNADLVVLSACETGLGPIARGEGVLGLTRGFLYAGSSNVLVSLWKADDIQTSQLMPDFYRSLLRGMGMPSALRAAKLTLIQANSRYARPFYWAPFVLVGA